MFRRGSTRMNVMEIPVLLVTMNRLMEAKFSLRLLPELLRL